MPNVFAVRYVPDHSSEQKFLLWLSNSSIVQTRLSITSSFILVKDDNEKILVHAWKIIWNRNGIKHEKCDNACIILKRNVFNKIIKTPLKFSQKPQTDTLIWPLLKIFKRINLCFINTSIGLAPMTYSAILIQDTYLASFWHLKKPGAKA